MRMPGRVVRREPVSDQPKHVVPKLNPVRSGIVSHAPVNAEQEVETTLPATPSCGLAAIHDVL